MSSMVVADALRLVHGVTPAEFDHVVKVLGRLEERLRSFAGTSVVLDLRVKERDMPSQKTTLEASIGGRPPIVVQSSRRDFDTALIEVREELIRRITDAKTITEPRHNRALRRHI